ncbi:serine hydrolase domain-containing protein [Lutispora thermophila]|uniref:CubicO group peptidase, beta-lactamase class C family n=1 Tax=Lutispora thermophila DSM 19022 TaxID=1122184 RepID=A0A1M6GK13_9FIRM|nr:serine hydrolase domain-containing protein [Lutispora thermophila]SHJ10273.1 CubicO group peptidase, beta-lactamase class C family [Lutispora thermophila DSM 19022]
MYFNVSELDQKLAEKIKEKNLPGVSVCIRGPEGVILEKGYGYADGNMTRLVDGDTIYGIASLSKSMTTLACAILATEGKLSFDDPVYKYFPNFEVPGNPKDSVTLRHLAMHTAGIPPMEPLEWSIAMNTSGRNSRWLREMRRTAINKMDNIHQIIDYIAEGRYPTLGGPGEYMSYSNEGYAILSYVVDMAAGVTLEEFLKERVFEPIGMNRTVIDYDCSEAKAISGGNITQLFGYDDDGKLYADDNWSILPPFRGCACVKSTAHDMARYYQCLSNNGIIDGRQAIPSKAVEILVGDEFPEQEKAFYCLGLNKRVKNGHVICEHSGGLHGVSSFGGFFKGENYGFSVLCNMSEEDVEDLGWMMYNMVMGRPLEEDHYWLHPTGTDFTQPEMLVGTYRCHEGIPVDIKVYIKDGKLMVADSVGEMTTKYCGETWFQAFRQEPVPAKRLRFWVRNGKAWGVTVYTRLYQRVDD